MQEKSASSTSATVTKALPCCPPARQRGAANSPPRSCREGLGVGIALETACRGARVNRLARGLFSFKRKCQLFFLENEIHATVLDRCSPTWQPMAKLSKKSRRTETPAPAVES